ncbi:MAG: DUF6160 family protein [Marinobacter sp.]
MKKSALGLPLALFFLISRVTRAIEHAMKISNVSLTLPLALLLTSTQAWAEMSALGETELSDVTGANGITMEMSSLASVGHIEFESSGSVRVDDLVAGGAGVTTSGASTGFGQYFDQLTLSLDILEDGVMQVGLRSLPTGTTGDPDTVDWGITTGNIDLIAVSGESARIASGLEAWGRILSADYKIGPSLDVAGYDSQRALMMFTIEDLDLLAGAEGLAVQNLKVLGTEDIENGGTTLGANALTAFFTNETNLSSDEINRSVSGAEQGFAVINSSIGVEPVDVDGVTRELRTIRIDAMAADVSVESMAVGGTALGATHLDNLRVSDTTIRFNNY